MHTDFHALAAMTRPAAYIDNTREVRPWAALFIDSRYELMHLGDESPLPSLAPLVGHPPSEALIRAVVEADLDALRAALAADSSGINDPIPETQGKVLLHFAARFHGQAAQGQSHAEKVRRLKLEHITRALLDAGADPLAEDDLKLRPATYSHGHTPACLRDRQFLAARDGRFHTSSGTAIINKMPRKKVA